MSKTSEVEIAKKLAFLYHDRQKRKDGTPYVQHVITVGDSFEDPLLRAAGYLHDILEDTTATVNILRREGISDKTIDLIIVLTRKKNESYKEFIYRLAEHSTNAMQLKLADLNHNLSNLPNGTLRDKYELAKAYLEVRLYGESISEQIGE